MLGFGNRRPESRRNEEHQEQPALVRTNVHVEMTPRWTLAIAAHAKITLREGKCKDIEARTPCAGRGGRQGLRAAGAAAILTSRCDRGTAPAVRTVRSPMKIVEIRGYELRSKLPEPQGNSTGFVNEISTLMVSVRTDTGVVGWGETWAAPASASTLIRRHLGPLLLGRDPMDHGVIWHEMVRQRGYDRRGHTMMAMSALDLALWDAAARAQGLPVWALLGGRQRDRLVAYASGPYFRQGPDPYARFAQEVNGYLEAGFQAIKLRIGTTPREDRRICLEMRAAMGSDRLLMVDLNQGYSLRTALETVHAINDADIHWVEEPLPPDDVVGYRLFAASTPVAVAAGEALAGCEAYVDFINSRSIDIVQPDLAVCGGLTEALRIAALAYAADIRVAPHVIGGAVNFFSALHFAAVLPSRSARPFHAYPIFEYDQTPNALRDVVPLPPLDGNGTIGIPVGPGFGFELDPAQLTSLAVDTWALNL
ncbi:MAG: mandelate racemase/muconate lactonizing enzyme family protein [Casimicrobiaceae bacterium]